MIGVFFSQNMPFRLKNGQKSLCKKNNFWMFATNCSWMDVTFGVSDMGQMTGDR